MRIIIDGNIGCGKSTVIKSISNRLSMLRVIQENVHDWEPYLKSFYNDMKQNSLQFQMKVLEHHLKSGNETKNDKFSIHERSLLSCVNIFGRDLYNSGFLKELDMNLMNSYCNNFGWIPDIIIYLKADTDVCYNRCLKRNRDGEESIPRQYLENINKLYDDYYLVNGEIKDNNSLSLGANWYLLNDKPVKVYTINANQHVNNVSVNTLRIIKEIINNH